MTAQHKRRARLSPDPDAYRVDLVDEPGITSEVYDSDTRDLSAEASAEADDIDLIEDSICPHREGSLCTYLRGACIRCGQIAPWVRADGCGS